MFANNSKFCFCFLLSLAWSNVLDIFRVAPGLGVYILGYRTSQIYSLTKLGKLSWYENNLTVTHLLCFTSKGVVALCICMVYVIVRCNSC